MSFNELKECRYGPLLFNKNDWPIGFSLREYGEYAWQELELIRQLVHPGDLVVDIGANIGTHTVFMAQIVGNAGAVVSFEPQRISFQTLCANVALNNLTNVHPFNAALGKEVGQIIVPVRDQNKPNNFGGVPLAGATDGERTDLLTLDSIGLSACAFIKADIEGMEAEFLAGAAKTIERFRPIMYMEADGAQAKDAIQMLIDLKYDCYWSLPPLYNAENFARNKVNALTTEDGRALVSINMICVPVEKNIEVSGFKRIESADENPPSEITIQLWKEEVCLV